VTKTNCPRWEDMNTDSMWHLHPQFPPS
jgi:hypothetical protein